MGVYVRSVKRNKQRIINEKQRTRKGGEPGLKKMR